MFAVVPAFQLDFPWYHPDRSRFFNTATLFMEIMTALGRGVEIFSNKVETTNNKKLFSKLNKDLNITEVQRIN